MKIKVLTVVIISYFIEFALQFIMANKAEAGDHVDYRKYYDYISDLNFNEFLSTDSAGFIGSYDYLYNFLVYLFSRNFSFDFYTFIINIAFFSLFVIIYIRIGMLYIILILPFTFYVVGLQFSAQRLILAISIFGFAFLYGKSKISLISLLAHVQAAPLFLLYNKIKLWIHVLAIIIISLISFYFDITAVQKFLLYSSNRNEIKMEQYLFLIMIFFTLIMSMQKEEIKYLILPFFVLFFLITIIGDGRINIIIYLFSLLLLQKLNKVAPLTQLSLCLFILYDLFKGILFISGILDGNSGFDSIKIS